ncbi:NADPH-dependent L-lysine N(6)-monooxygenase, partial [Vibrio cholerae]
MTCPSCVAHVKEALDAIEGVNKVEISYENARATITTNGGVSVTVLIGAIEALGYIAKESTGTAKEITSPNDCCDNENASNTESNQTQHVAIIGTGSGAFACAIKAAEGGAKVTLIEGADVIGGCCVNVGCVPSKILIRAAQLAQQQRNNPFTGLENHAPQLSRALLTQQQTARVEELRAAKYQNILETNPALSLLKGWAQFKNANTLIVRKNDGTEQAVHADKILIATGSTPTIPPIDGLTETPYWTSTEALFAQELPQHLVVIGSSVVALEIAQAYRRLGSEVT